VAVSTISKTRWFCDGPVRSLIAGESRRPARDVAIAGGLLFLASLVLTVTTAEVYDDPWILYRYASNLASGSGWTFNPGWSQPNAVTSPLTVLLLAAQLKVGVSLAVASAVIYLAGTWSAAFFAFLTLRAVGRPLSGMIGASLVVSSPWLASLRGMESALLLGATGIGLWSATVKHRWVTGMSLGFAVLARPDAVVFAGCMLAYLGLRDRSLPWREATGLICSVLPWLGYAVVRFHSVLPSTLAAKQAQRASGEWPGLTLSWLRTVASEGRLGALCIVALLALGGLAAMTRVRSRPLMPLVVSVVLTFVAYEFVLGIAGYPWYAASLVYASLLLGAEGLDYVARNWPRLRIAVWGTALALAVLGATSRQHMDAERQDYATIAQWLQENSDPHSTVAATEVGRLGYLSGLRMIDYLGLLDPRAISHIQHRDWGWWLDVQRPDYWVTSSSHTWRVEARVFDLHSFGDTYRLVFRTRELEVYKRNTDGNARVD
jgi:hypothetical protein